MRNEIVPVATLRWTLLVNFLVMALAMHGAFARDGDVDPTFGAGGQILIPRPDNHGDTNTKATGDMVVLADGRFLWSAPLDDETIWIGRNARDGTADTTFGSEGNGRVTLPMCGQRFRPVRMISDGANGVIMWSDRCLRHILDDGSLDSSFALGVMPPSSFIAADLARASSGNLLLAGLDAQLGQVYRFDENGTIDNTFGIAGKVVIVPPTGEWKSVNALVIRPDGRLLIGGSGGADHDEHLFVAQLSGDGSLDLSWNQDGFVVLQPPPTVYTMEANAFALDGDGSVVVSGMENNGTTGCCILLTRLDEAGHSVPGFGLRLFELPGSPKLFTGAEDRGDVVILPNHRIIVASSTFPISSENHRTQFTLVRTFADGSLDPGFGHDGWNSYTILSSLGANPTGDYNQMHAIGYDHADGSMLILGRTFFEDSGSAVDYVSMVRARLDLIFEDSFE